MTPILRRVLTWLCAALALIAATALVTLSLGRPLFYSDGERLISALDLQDASMLTLGRPEPVLEIPGPVRGRVVRLADGRLLYGRGISESDTDLVVWDPRRKDLSPEPVTGLRTRSHELAPFLASDGTLYFASDREGGLGGFDLWRTSWRDGKAGVVEHLPDGINTAFDEIDPTLDPGGQTLVFARRDDGRDARLFSVWLGDPSSPVPLLSDVQDPRRNGIAKGRTVLDREPCFSTEGASLWFVRELQGEAPQLLRTARFQKAWSDPVVVDLGGEFHAPVTAEREIWLLGKSAETESAPALLYRVRQEELLPWRAAQRTLEIVLLSLLAAALLALVMLQLGKRFTKLDTITICLLASLLVHIVLLLWLGRVEIMTGRAPVSDGGGGQLEVTVISALQGDAAALLAGNASLSGSGLVDATRMERHQGELGSEAPTSGLASEVAPSAARQPDPAGPVEATSIATEVSPLRDAAVLGAEARRAGTDPTSEVTVGAGAEPEAPKVAAGVAPRRTVAALGSKVETVTVPAAEIGALSAEVVGASKIELPSLEAVPVDIVRVAAPSTASLLDNAAGGTAALRTQEQAPREVVPSHLAAPSVTGIAPAAMTLPKSVRPGSARGAEAVVVPSTELLALADRPKTVDTGADMAVAESQVARPRVALSDKVVLDPRVGQKAASEGNAAARDAFVPLPQVVEPQAAAIWPLAGAMVPTRAVAQRRDRGSEKLELPDSELLTGVGSSSRRPLVADAQVAAPRGPARGAEVRDAVRGSGSSQVGGKRRELELVAARWPVAALWTTSGPVIRPRWESFTTGVGSFVPPRPPSSFLEAAPIAVRGDIAQSDDLSPYQNRFGPRRAQALEAFGGTAETEAAVQRGLRYLAKIQQEDGGFGVRRREDPKYGDVRVGKSGLCLLAFLGAGHSQVTDTAHSETVARIVDYLLAQQDARTGHFGRGSAYDHGICTYALAECFGMTKDSRLQQPLERALAWIGQKQNRTRDARNEGGWGYFSSVLQPEDRFSRTSITAWMVMALESAKLAGLTVDAKILERARDFLLRSFDQEHGYFLYNKEPSRLASEWRTLPASTPASVFALFLVGVGADDFRMRAGLEYTIDRKPSQFKRADSEEFVLQAQSHVYFWYYGSLACFLSGGTIWQDWNEALKRVLLPAQSKDGSFAPVDIYAEYAGDTTKDRAYTTAMCVLCLEVYYRYFTPLLKGR